MKRESNEDSNSQPDKRNRRNEEQVRILIPSNIAGAIIGKGGQHIQKMRTQYKATVFVDDADGPERTVLIATDLDSTMQIITEMLKHFEESNDEIDVRLLIHQTLAGYVIGKGGQTIKELREKIGCRTLKVFSSVAPQSTDRVVQTVGKQEQVLDAIREVISLTREAPIKGAVHNYDPVNFDRMYADEYGGYGGSGNGGGGGGGKNRQSRGGNRGFGGGGGGGDRSRSGGGNFRDNSNMNPWANDDRFGGGRNSGFGGNNFGGGGNFGGGNFGNGGGGNFGNNDGHFGGGDNFGRFGNPGGNMGNFNNSRGFGNNFGGGMNQGGNFGNNMGNGRGGGGRNSGFGNAGGGGSNGNGMGSGGGNSGGGFGGRNSAFNNDDGNAIRPVSVGSINEANLPDGHDPNNSTQVTIPKDLGGAIIGKGGERIRHIRNESAAHITIDEPLPGSNDRIITISGTPKQIQMAQYLLQQCVQENSRRN